MLTPQRYSSGKTVTMKTTSEKTITKFDALEIDSSGYVERADSSTAEIRVVALEDKTTAAGTHHDILCLFTKGVQFICDTNGNMAQSKVGTYVELTDHETVNEAGTGTDVFYVTAMVGATTDKKCKGFFVVKTD